MVGIMRVAEKAGQLTALPGFLKEYFVFFSRIQRIILPMVLLQ